MVESWSKHLFCCVHVDNVMDGSNFENFIKVIMNAYLTKNPS